MNIFNHCKNIKDTEIDFQFMIAIFIINTSKISLIILQSCYILKSNFDEFFCLRCDFFRTPIIQAVLKSISWICLLIIYSKNKIFQYFTLISVIILTQQSITLKNSQIILRKHSFQWLRYVNTPIANHIKEYMISYLFYFSRYIQVYLFPV